jgi:hypothetical protein
MRARERQREPSRGVSIAATIAPIDQLALEAAYGHSRSESNSCKKDEDREYSGGIEIGLGLQQQYAETTLCSDEFGDHATGQREYDSDAEPGEDLIGG